MAKEETAVGRAREGRLTRRSDPWTGGPAGLLGRFAEEMDRLFDDFGLGRGSLAPRLGIAPWRTMEGMLWSPDIEVSQRGDEMVIRADLPGLGKDEVQVDVTNDAVTIQGERRREQQEEREGLYRSERSYGRFCRVIPLPEGAITDQAKATFRDGVLEVKMPAPPEQVTQGRRLEIAEAKK